MPRYARLERHALADTLLTLGPDRPTLCSGWETRHLAAHVVLRDRRPDAVAALLPPLRGYGDRLLRAKAARPYPELVDELRHPPRWSPLSTPPLDELANTVEFFVHHEDVRRAQPDWQPRDLPADHEGALWKRVPLLARTALRRFPAALTVQAPGYGERSAGAGGEPVRLVGAPGELLLFLFGRQRAARVQVTGPAPLAERLRNLRLGI